MTFDPMAAAIDWLDAYREEDLDLIIAMYADDATVHCNCVDSTIVSGANKLRHYWMIRLRDHPASELLDLNPMENGALISFATRLGAMNTLLSFDSSGRIVEQNFELSK
jgi:hypothetical protein